MTRDGILEAGAMLRAGDLARMAGAMRGSGASAMLMPWRRPSAGIVG